MRRPTVLAGLAILVVALSACGSSAAKAKLIEFGVAGGNMRPYRVTIQPNGTVRVRGSMKVKHRELHQADVRRLRSEIENAHLSDRQCTGVLPDVGSEFVRFGNRTVTVHGSCEPAFGRVWNDLVATVALSPA